MPSPIEPASPLPQGAPPPPATTLPPAPPGDRVSLAPHVEAAPRWRRQRRLLLTAALWAGGALALAGSAALLLCAVLPRFDLELAATPAPPPAPGASGATPAGSVCTAALAADDAIGERVGAGALADDPDGWRGVAASPNQYGVVAVWDARTLWLSRDDGRTFHQALAGRQPLAGVSVGRDGRVFAARQGGWLGWLTPAGAVRWRHIDLDQVLAVDARGPWLAVFGLTRDRADGLSPLLLLSRDHGRSFRRQVVPAYGDAGNQVRVQPGGTIDLLLQTGGAEAGARHLRGHVNGRPFVEAWNGSEPQPLGLTHDGGGLALVGDASTRPGASVELRRCPEAAPQIAPSAGLTPPERPQDGASGRGASPRRCGGPVRAGPSSAAPLAVHDWNVIVGASATRTLAVIDGALEDLSPVHGAEIVSPHTPGPVRTLAVDGLGRGLAVVGRTAVRFSALHGWRRLFDRPRT